MIEKIKAFKEDAEEVYEGIDGTLINSKYWPVWYFIKGHIIACVGIYWILILGSAITHKKLGFIDRES